MVTAEAIPDMAMMATSGKRERGKRLAALLTRKPKQARQQRMPGSRTRASRG
jgi:hypothetical protein